MEGIDTIHSFTLGDLLREQRRSYADRTAVVCGAHRFTYPELDDRVNRLATGLADLGVVDGERVLWLGQNCHRFFETLLATAKLGAICCPANWRLSGDEMTFVIDDSKPKVVIWQEEEIGERVRAAREKATHEARWVQHDNGEYEALIAAGSPTDPAVPVDPATSALMLYTAAFDGMPNGALRLRLASESIRVSCSPITSGAAGWARFMARLPAMWSAWPCVLRIAATLSPRRSSCFSISSGSSPGSMTKASVRPSSQTR